jgi:hypothetical protein
MPEVSKWFNLYRYLSARNLTRARELGSKPDLVLACEKVLARTFQIDGEDAQLWSNVFLTYIMGGLAFNALLGTTEEETDRVLARLGRIVRLVRDDKISLDD